MPKTYIEWNPVGDYGCGDRDCPQCGPMIELANERKHRKRVAATFPRSTPADQVNAWFGELHGTAAERNPGSATEPAMTKAERALARAQRDQGQEKVLVVRSLPPKDVAKVQASLKEYPLRREYLRRNARGKLSRKEWITEVWLQLLNPTALIGRRERHMSLGQKLSRAMERAQRTMRQEQTRIGRENAAAGKQQQ